MADHQHSFTDPPEDQPPARDWRDPTVREREASTKALAESRRLLIAAGAKGVRAVDEREGL